MLLVIGEKVGFENINLPSKMNKTIVMFVEKEDLVNWLISNRIFTNGDYLFFHHLLL